MRVRQITFFERSLSRMHTEIERRVNRRSRRETLIRYTPAEGELVAPPAVNFQTWLPSPAFKA
jgi:hypothetical protein